MNINKDLTMKHFVIFALAICMIAPGGGHTLRAQSAGGGMSPAYTAHYQKAAAGPSAYTEAPGENEVVPEAVAKPTPADLTKQMAVERISQDNLAVPQNDVVGMLFVLSRKAAVRVSLSDENGVQLCPPLESTYSPGMHKAIVTTKHLTAGTYSLGVTTEGITRVKSFVIR